MGTLGNTETSGANPERLHDIASVARVTGLTAANIRAWEKRYKTITPQRTESGRRLYTDADVQKLRLLKQLADGGVPIRTTAALSIDELESRLRELAPPTATRSTPAPSPLSAGQLPRVLAVGGHARRRLQRVSELGLAFERVALDPLDSDDYSAQRSPDLADILVVEAPALFGETIADFHRLRQRFGAKHVLALFRYSQSTTLERVQREESKLMAVQEPISDDGLRNALARLILAATRDRIDQELTDLRHEGPPGIATLRRFDDEALEKVSLMESTVECECPKHVASLLKGLNAFEAYSAACESRNPADAQLHHYLYQTTLKARVAMEEAMERLLRFEGIDLDQV